MSAVDEATLDGDYLEGGRETIRGAARWLIGSFGAIGAVLVAGSQLSSIGSLPSGDRRLWIAIAGMGLALVAILAGISVVVGLLLPIKWTFTDVCDRWDRSGAVLHAGVPSRWGRWRYPEVHRLARAPELLGDAAPRVLLNAYRKAPRDRQSKIAADIEAINGVAGYITLEVRFRRARAWLAAAALIAAGGVSSFAWAANPPDAALRSPTLRATDLSGADLRGANLVGADLTAANLSRANAAGAQMSDAIVDDVTWDDTTCPDGVNSDDAGDTCEGHLSPLEDP